MFSIVHCILPLVLGIACYTEIRFRRIPNVLTVSTMIFGLAGWGILNGLDGILFSLYGLLIGGGVFLPFCLMGILGGGDMKLMAAAGAVIGYPLIIPALCYTCFSGGIIALVTAAWQGQILSALARCFHIIFGGSKKRSEGLKKAPTLPYGIAIASGTILALLLSF